jgi:membrane peptidoglycan carboxypeptidase
MAVSCFYLSQGSARLQNKNNSFFKRAICYNNFRFFDEGDRQQFMNRNSGRNRRARNSVTTKSGNTIKLNRSLSDRRKARHAARADAHAAYLATLPKERWKRWLYRLNPKHLAEFWFSREGGIMALKIIGACIIVGFFLTIGMFAYFRKDLPRIKDLSGDNLGGSITYYDSTGKTVLWQDYDAVKRIPVTSDNISPYMKDATVAIEDKDFYKEGAFDVRGILRATVNDAKGGSGLQGGSTITQQLVKLNEGWTDNRTITRKVKELILAVELEREYSKNDILTGYLNIAPYGGVEYGVQSAARDYFQTDAKDLTLPQAAMLAAIPQSPSYYSPYGSTQFNPDAGNTFSQSALLTRQHYILDQMAKQGYITQAQANAAKAVDVIAEVHPQQGLYNNIVAPYFVLAAKQQLEKTYGTALVARGGWNVTTSLNMSLQQNAETDVAANAKNVARYGGNQEAMVAEDVQTGQVVAAVGGENFSPDYPGGEINFANTLVSPGSSLKPFVYAAMLQNNNNVGAGSFLYDSQDAIPGYACTDKTALSKNNNGGSTGNCLFDDTDQFPGPVTVRYALAGSRNVPAVKASFQALPATQKALIGNGVIGSQFIPTTSDVKSVNKWISMANAAMGTKNAYACYQSGTTPLTATPAQQTQCYGDAAIGGGYVDLDQEINGDSTLARLGHAIPQTYILNITDASGKNIYKWSQPKGTQVYSADTAYIINNILDDPKATYLPTYQKFQNYNGWDISVKTGTQNDSKNGVMTAWSTKYAVIGFAGSDTLTKQLAAGQFENLTEPITKTWLEQALTALHTKPTNWTAPSDLKTESAYSQRAFSDYGAVFPGPSTDIYPSWYKAGGTAKKAAAQTLDRVSGLTATSCTPSLAREYISSGGAVSNLNIDIFHGGVPNIATTSASSTTQSSSKATDDVHNCNDSPPTITLTAPSACQNSCSITATASQGTHPLSDAQYASYPGTIKFSLNGQVINSQACSDSEASVCTRSFIYTPTSSGSATLTATVTDSVLYSGTTSQAISLSQSKGPISITSPSSGQVVAGSSLNVSWSGGGGTYTVSVSPGGVGCSGTSNSCSVTLPNIGSYTIEVSDNNGDSPNSVTVTRGT